MSELKASPIASKLRTTILQQAIQGKLVSQNPEDEPACVFIERIRKRQAELIKEKKAKRPKSSENVIWQDENGSWWERQGKANPVCIDKEIPFDIPGDWEWARLPDVVDMTIGKTPSRHEGEYWRNGVVPWFSISDMIDRKSISNPKEFISTKAMENCFKSGLVPAGTLIMSFKLTIGKVSILSVNAVYNEAIVGLLPWFDNKYIFRNYLFFVLPFFAKRGESLDAIKGTTLNKGSLSKLLIPVPPLAEQQRIVERINEIMPLIDRLEKLERERAML